MEEEVRIAELKDGDRVVLTCEEARNPGSRPARFETILDGRAAVFLVQTGDNYEVHMLLKVAPDGTLSDDEGRAITVRRDEHREGHG